MTLPVGGWTTDEGYGDALVLNGLQNTIFRSVVKQTANAILAAKEIAGTLTAPEKLLQADLDTNGVADILVGRMIAFLRQDATGKWTARGTWMASGEISALLTTAWPNILKKYS